DLPQVTAGAPSLLAHLGVADRVRVESGSFFERVPAGADAYLMKGVLHDWDDDRCLTILENCRKAMSPGGRILVVDAVGEDRPAAGMIKSLDFFILTVAGGKGRTADEFAHLFARAGLKLSGIHPTQLSQSVLEGRLAA